MPVLTEQFGILQTVSFTAFSGGVRVHTTRPILPVITTLRITSDAWISFYWTMVSIAAWVISAFPTMAFKPSSVSLGAITATRRTPSRPEAAECGQAAPQKCPLSPRILPEMNALRRGVHRNAATDAENQ